MTRWAEERRAAHKLRSRAVPEGTILARDVIDAVQRFTQIEHQATYEGDDVLDGADAQLDVEMNTIWYSAAIQPALVPFYLAHEYAHLQLNHGGCRGQHQGIDAEFSDAGLDAGVERVERYSPEERRERAANVFARELLLPAPLLRSWFSTERRGASEIAERVDLPRPLVVQQLAVALLADDGDARSMARPSPAERVATVVIPLDSSQVAAATVPRGPLLLEAGPGTGKTRTLIARVEHLLRQGVTPGEIVILTFSNRAAEELRDRVAVTAPEAAADLWVGTFHAFGLELLRKYGRGIGLSARLGVLDPFRALLFLEENLPALRLDHYQDLAWPSQALRRIAGAISRAKDELCGPQRYEELGENMRAAALAQRDADAVTVAERVLEVAHVYRFYQDHLTDGDLVDFGDLIARSVELLRSDDQLREEIRQRYRHVLVDEYQDVNHASAMLLRELAGDGENLWVVADPRQAIYRFRGASPGNVARFADHFPAPDGPQALALGFNYRSRRSIIDLTSELATKMPRGSKQAFNPWVADRTDGPGDVRLEVAETFEAEMAGIVAEIQRQRQADVPYRDQVVLGRTHTILGRVAEALERAGIPTYYFGNLFERPEVRDLLALLSLVAEGDGIGLVRVAAFREYGIPLPDVLTLLAEASRREASFPAALSLRSDVELSAAGRSGLDRLAGHIEAVPFATGPWSFLAAYLFDHSDYLRLPEEAQSSEDVAGLLRRSALHEFLGVAHHFERTSRAAGMPALEVARLKSRFLRHVRDLQVYGEERQYRQPPPLSVDVEAVRVLTMHASKGLEFPVVYLPYLAAGQLPLSDKGKSLPPPVDMIEYPEPEADDLYVFFVALSRARDTLVLSRSQRYGRAGRGSNPSQYLELLKGRLPIRTKPTWVAGPPADVRRSGVDASEVESGIAEVFGQHELDTYLRCPRRYFYDNVLGLEGRYGGSGHLRLHRAVHRTLRWVEEQRGREGQRMPGSQAIQEQLAAIWVEAGPVGHPHETLYWHEAERMLGLGVAMLSERTGRFERASWEVDVPGGLVRVEPH